MIKRLLTYLLTYLLIGLFFISCSGGVAPGEQNTPTKNQTTYTTKDGLLSVTTKSDGILLKINRPNEYRHHRVNFINESTHCKKLDLAGDMEELFYPYVNAGNEYSISLDLIGELSNPDEWADAGYNLNHEVLRFKALGGKGDILLNYDSYGFDYINNDFVFTEYSLKNPSGAENKFIYNIFERNDDGSFGNLEGFGEIKGNYGKLDFETFGEYLETHNIILQLFFNPFDGVMALIDGYFPLIKPNTDPVYKTKDGLLSVTVKQDGLYIKATRPEGYRHHFVAFTNNNVDCVNFELAGDSEDEYFYPYVTENNKYTLSLYLRGDSQNEWAETPYNQTREFLEITALGGKGDIIIKTGDATFDFNNLTINVENFYVGMPEGLVPAFYYYNFYDGDWNFKKSGPLFVQNTVFDISDVSEAIEEGKNIIDLMIGPVDGVLVGIANGLMLYVDHSHDISLEWNHNSDLHWHEASCGREDHRDFVGYHNFIDLEVIKYATCEETGLKKIKCYECGFVTEEVIPINNEAHSYQVTFEADDLYHWHRANCSHNYLTREYVLHPYGEWKITLSPTENRDGSQNRTCKICGYVQIQSIPATIHSHTVLSTWNNDDVSHWHEASCGRSEHRESFGNHSFIDVSVTKVPTCTEKGLKTVKCQVCNYEKQVEIPIDSSAHHFDNSTWIKDGNYHWHVADCGHNVAIDKSTHSFGSWTTTKTATEDADGLKKRTCNICKYVESQVIPRKTDTYSTSWSKNETQHWHEASCGKEEHRSDVSNHTFKLYARSAPTCTKTGIEVYECTTCYYRKNVTVAVNSNEHTFDTSEWKFNDSTHWQVSNCGHSVKGNEGKHVFGEWRILKKETCNATGTRWRKCKTCDAEQSETIAVNPNSHVWKEGRCSVCGANPRGWLAKDDWMSENGNIVINGREFDRTSEVIVIPEGVSYTTRIKTDEAWEKYIDDLGKTTSMVEYKGSFTDGVYPSLYPYVMSKYEVTRELYEAVTGVTLGTDDVSGTRKYNPVGNISFVQAAMFCNKLSMACGLECVYRYYINGEYVTDPAKWEKAYGTYTYQKYAVSDSPWRKISIDTSKNGYRMPTGQEWEFAARGGDFDSLKWGFAFAGVNTQGGKLIKYRDLVNYNEDSNLNTVGWYSGNSNGMTHEVGQKQANPLGLYDMCGNVSEWVSDYYEFTSGTKERRYRGGSYRSYPYNCFVSAIPDAAAASSTDGITYASSSIGIRLVRKHTF